MKMMGRVGLHRKAEVGHWCRSAVLRRRGLDLRLRWSVPDRSNAGRHADTDGCSDSPIHPNAAPTLLSRRPSRHPTPSLTPYANADTYADARTCPNANAHPYADADTHACADEPTPTHTDPTPTPHADAHA